MLLTLVTGLSSEVQTSCTWVLASCSLEMYDLPQLFVALDESICAINVNVTAKMQRLSLFAPNGLTGRTWKTKWHCDMRHRTLRAKAGTYTTRESALDFSNCNKTSSVQGRSRKPLVWISWNKKRKRIGNKGNQGAASLWLWILGDFSTLSNSTGTELNQRSIKGLLFWQSLQLSDIKGNMSHHNKMLHKVIR